MATTSKKMMITDVFVNGAFQGWNIATHSTIPNVLMAFVIIKMLNISGALDFIIPASDRLWPSSVCQAKLP